MKHFFRMAMVVLTAFHVSAQSTPEVLAYGVVPFAYDDNGKASGNAVELFSLIVKEAGVVLPPSSCNRLVEYSVPLTRGIPS